MVLNVVRDIIVWFYVIFLCKPYRDFVYPLTLPIDIPIETTCSDFSMMNNKLERV